MQKLVHDGAGRASGNWRGTERGERGDERGERVGPNISGACARTSVENLRSIVDAPSAVERWKDVQADALALGSGGALRAALRCVLARLVRSILPCFDNSSLETHAHSRRSLDTPRLIADPRHRAFRRGSTLRAFSHYTATAGACLVVHDGAEPAPYLF